MPRALGDVVLCPHVVGDAWQAPLVHGLLHLLGYDHGAAMEERERVHAMSANRRPPSIIESFNFAAEGIIHVLRTQRNMRIHFAVAVLVLIVALVSGVDKLELIALLLAIAFVLIAEMLNTAVEAAIDVATTSFDPMAKLAKDIAAGAVLIATGVAVAVGYLVFSGQVAERSSTLLNRLTDAPAELTLVALVLTTILVVATKAMTGRGSPLRGGLPSGHAAVAFAGWMAATLILEDSNHHFLISSLTFIMALLVAQTRVESGIHSSVEVAYGGLLGALVTLAVFQVGEVSELVAKAEAVAARAYAPYSNYHVGARRAHDRRTRVRGRERRERGVPARRLRREERARGRGRRRLRPGLDRGDRDHRLSVRRLPPVAARVPDPGGQLPAGRRLDRDLSGERAAAGRWNLPGNLPG